MQRKHPAIDHRVAAQTIGGTPAESFAIILPSQCPPKGLWPLVMAFVGAVDLRGDRELVVPSGRNQSRCCWSSPRSRTPIATSRRSARIDRIASRNSGK